MRIINTKFWIFAIIIITCVIGSIAYNYMGMKWPTGTSVGYHVNANTSDVGDEASAVVSAAGSWSSICPSGITLGYGGSTSTTGHGSNGINTVSWVDEGDNSTLATAYVWYSGDTTLETDMVFNDHYNWDTSGADYDVESIALHEFGHWLGLDHGPGIMGGTYSGVDRGVDSDSAAGIRDLYGCGNGDDDQGGGDDEEQSPSIDLDTSSLSFMGSEGKQFKVRNAGGGTLNFVVYANRNWMNFSPDSGSSRGEWVEITVSVNAAKIQSDNTGTIYVSSDEAGNSPLKISVTVESFILTIETTPGGTTDPAPDTYIYYSVTQVTITATPDANARFTHWSGDASGSDNPITVTVDSNKTVRANFVRQFTLTIESGPSGTTSPEPGSYVHDEGTRVSVTAIPDDNYRFTHWSGDASGSDNPNEIIVDSDMAIKANFVRVYRLTISVEGGGITDPGPGTHTYDEGSEASVEAIPNANFRFLNWSGDASGTDNPVTVVMNSDKSIKAHFIRIYTLIIRVNTGGTTDPTPGTYRHDQGASVSIRAIPNNHYVFEAWSGDASGATNPISITMNSDKTITALFRLIHKPLNLSGKKVINRSLSQNEYVIVLTWGANPNNVNITNYRIYQLEGGQKIQLGELSSRTFEYWHRNVVGDKQYTYAVVAVGAEGTEGELAVVTIR